MKKQLTTAALGLLVGLSGCATTPKPVAYQEKHSRAYNIAQAGGLSEVKDQVVPRADFEALQTAGNVTADTLALTSSAGLGLGFGPGFALALVNSAIAPKGTAERSSLVAWLPASAALNTRAALDAMFSHVKESAETTLAEMGAEFLLTSEQEVKRSGKTVLVAVYGVMHDDWGCPKESPRAKARRDDFCFLTARVVEPDLAPAPTFFPELGDPAFRFSSSHKAWYNTLEFRRSKTSTAPEDALYSNLSKNLPAWSFLYLAPKAVTLSTGEQIGFPYLLEQGRVELFVFPKD